MVKHQPHRPSGSSKCIWGHFTGRQQARRGELTYLKPHGRAAVGLSLGPGGGQGKKLLEGAATAPGAPQVGVGRLALHSCLGGVSWAKADAQTHSRLVGWAGWGRKLVGGRRRKLGLIRACGQDRLPWPQIGAPGRPVRSVGSIGRLPGLGPTSRWDSWGPGP